MGKRGYENVGIDFSCCVAGIDVNIDAYENHQRHAHLQ